jgi:Fibronectin type III domain
MVAGYSAPSPNRHTTGSADQPDGDPDDSQVTLSWNPPPEAKPPVTVASYDVYQGTKPGGESSATVLAQGTSCTVTGLTNGTTCYFVVTATLSESGKTLGQGPSSVEASATPVAAAQLGTPTGLTATAGDSQVTLSWNPPPGNGPPVAGYNIYDGTSPGRESGTPVNTSPVQGTSYRITGLTNGTTYYFPGG